MSITRMQSGWPRQTSMFWDEVIRFLDKTEDNADCNDRNKVIYYCSQMEECF